MKNTNTVGLYIHIPFCRQKCLYCDFPSWAGKEGQMQGYVDALTKEIRKRGTEYTDQQVVSVFFGGGTPTTLTIPMLEQLMQAVFESWNIAEDAEITTEANPGMLDGEMAAALKKMGFNRLSMGVQAWQNRLLKDLGRIHTIEGFLENYKAVREAGFENVNVDLMFALPNQTMADWQETVRNIISLQPEHISAYSLIIEEGTPFFERYGSDFEESFCSHGNSEKEENVQKKYPPLPDEDTERLMYHKTNAFLQKAGYERYEISNFAQEGYECRHNLTYWTGVDYIGFGVGAASYFQGFRYKNISDVKKYKNLLSEQKNRKAGGQEPFMPKQDPWHEEVQLLTMEEKMEEYMFLGLRLKKGISGKDFQKKFGKTVDEIYGNVITRFMKEGLLIQKGEWISLSKKGTDVANYVMAEFLLS